MKKQIKKKAVEDASIQAPMLIPFGEELEGNCAGGRCAMPVSLNGGVSSPTYDDQEQSKNLDPHRPLDN